MTPETIAGHARDKRRTSCPVYLSKTCPIQNRKTTEAPNRPVVYGQDKLSSDSNGTQIGQQRKKEKKKKERTKERKRKEKKKLRRLSSLSCASALLAPSRPRVSGYE